MRIPESVRKTLRPITKYRFYWELRKYSGTEILAEPQAVNDLLAERIQSGGGCAVGKIGGTELRALKHFHRHAKNGAFCPEWDGIGPMLLDLSGVFPTTPELLSRFYHVYAEAVGALDILGVWFQLGENETRIRLAPHAALARAFSMEPFQCERPWTAALTGRRTLVISPFTSTIESQYQRRQEVWRSKPGLLPALDLLTMRCPLYAGLVAPKHRDWVEALEDMKSQMSCMEFDAVIVGAGAWSLPLVAHAKSLGKFGIHMGGSTQLLFGIKGGRWDDDPAMVPFFNDAWTRPSGEERPSGVRRVEGGCYW